jgi:LEA14-like dessication related protein
VVAFGAIAPRSQLRPRKSVRVVIAALALVLGSCSKPEPPRVTPRSIRVATVSPAGVGLALELDVYNPNSFPILAQNVSGTFEIGNGVEIGRGQAQPKSSIPAKGSTVIASQLAVTWTNAGALAPYALSPAAVPYAFRGVAAIGGERLNVDVPFTIKGELTREQVLQAGIRGLGGMGLPLP